MALFVVDVETAREGRAWCIGEPDRGLDESVLDGVAESVWIEIMKTTRFAILAGAILTAVGCVSTVDERSTAGVPFVKDKIQGRYERPVDQIFQAAKDVIRDNGVLVNESVIYNQTNAVKTVEGKVNQRRVWVRVEAVDPKITDVTVQARTPGGGSDIDLVHQLEKEIALKLK